MTNEQYEEYTKIRNTIKPVKDFLEWCGKKYRSPIKGLHPFQIVKDIHQIGLYTSVPFTSVRDNFYKIPQELQDRIVETIEKYIEEKEQEMELI